MENNENILEKNLSRKSRLLTKELEKNKRVLVQSYPNKQSAHGSIILASILSKKTDELLLKPWSWKPSPHEESINILVGYNSFPQKEGNTIFEITSENTLYTIPYTAVTMMMEVAVINEEKRHTALSSLYQEARKITDEDPILNDTKTIGTLKLYRKFMAITGGATKTLAEALHQTLNPFYPSFSGKPLEKIREELETLGLEPDKPFSEQDTKAMKKLAERLLNEIKIYNKTANAKNLVISTLIMKTNKNKEVELQELAEAIDIILDKNPGLLLYYYTNNKLIELILAERIHNIPYIANLLERLIKKEYENNDNLILIECEQDYLPSLTGDIARQNNIIPSNKALACKKGTNIYTSIYELEKIDQRIREKILENSDKKSLPKIIIK